ncbi:unnamed protein product [Didymodactylos carnosus]|uniref:Condensin complex subunit 2 n=1 Tax=Didymodactylos carnosus TaxID=1234261 RepID=A0A813XUA2_9BILA|nr:unnamed protein product [Didymodactylos carnosus]CAF3659355.1 unnamed protein product [Didymodactylos carnosus]
MSTIVAHPPPIQAGRRSLHASRRSTRIHLDESSQNSRLTLSTTTSGNDRRQSRLFNTSFNIDIEEPQKSSSELVALYQKTAELSAQGKITAKNAFEFRFIEYLPQILNNMASENKKNEMGPNFVKAGNVIDTSAKIYACRVDALHNETQKLSGDMLTTDETNEQRKLPGIDDDNSEINENQENIQPTKQKPTRRKNTAKIIVTDLSKITLADEFHFRPLQTTSLCRPNATEQNSIHKEFVAHMYSTGDYSTIEGFSNPILNEQDEKKMTNRWEASLEYKNDLKCLRDIIKPYENIEHTLGTQKLRDFTFNENRTDSFINTIHESSLVADSRFGDDREDIGVDDNNDIDHENGFYDEESNSHDVFMDAPLSDVRQDPSTNHGEGQSSHSLQINGDFPQLFGDEIPHMPHPPTIPTHFINDDQLSKSVLSSTSFVDQLPYLLKLKGDQEYSFFDASKLKLFAGPNVWKYQNLIEGNLRQVIHQQAQAPATAIKRRLRFDSGESQRSISSRRRANEKCDFFMDCSISRILGVRSKETSMKRITLRSREKQSTEIKLARKLVKMNDLSCPSSFPDLIFESFQTIMMSKKQRQEKLNDSKNEAVDDFNMDNGGGHDEDDIDLPAGFVHYDGVQATQDDHVYVVDRPIYYERIEYAKRAQRLDVKQLKREMLDEIHRQSQTISSTDASLPSNNISSVSNMNGTSDDNNKPVEFAQVCVNLFENQNLHLDIHDLPSAFYCMLINCNENKLYMKNTQGRDDILISRNPFTNVQDTSALSYSHTSSSNLSMSTLLS